MSLTPKSQQVPRTPASAQTGSSKKESSEVKSDELQRAYVELFSYSGVSQGKNELVGVFRIVDNQLQFVRKPEHQQKFGSIVETLTKGIPDYLKAEKTGARPTQFTVYPRDGLNFLANLSYYFNGPAGNASHVQYDTSEVQSATLPPHSRTTSKS